MFQPGDRCIIINSYAGDEGRIVTFEGYVSGPYLYESLVWNNDSWDGECDCIITAMDGVLHAVSISGNRTTYTTKPHISKWLRKLPTVEVEHEEEETVNA